jgi:hypothetical protein
MTVVSKLLALVALTIGSLWVGAAPAAAAPNCAVGVVTPHLENLSGRKVLIGEGTAFCSANVSLLDLYLRITNSGGSSVGAGDASALNASEVSGEATGGCIPGTFSTAGQGWWSGGNTPIRGSTGTYEPSDSACGVGSLPNPACSPPRITVGCQTR